MFDPKSPFNGALLSELAQDPADHDHLDAWLAHLHGYEQIQRGPYQSTHGMKHDGWSAMHPKQARRVAIPNYTADYNQLMPLYYEAQSRIAVHGCIDMYNYDTDERILPEDLISPARACFSGPDSKNRWAAGWITVEYPDSPDDLVLILHFEPTVAIAAAIITALEGQRAALAQSNITDFARPSEISNHKSEI